LWEGITTTVQNAAGQAQGIPDDDATAEGEVREVDDDQE
jgi:hypothetical protein